MGLLDSLRIPDNKIYSNMSIDLDRRSSRQRVPNDYSLKNMFSNTHFGEEKIRSRPPNRRVTLTRTPSSYLVKLRYKRKISLKIKPPQPDLPELPYRGILGYPDCTINDTDPTTQDRASFNKFTNEGEKMRMKHISGTSESSTVSKIVFRDFEIETWYTAPYPEEYSQSNTLYICEHCLKYMNSPLSYQRHQLKYCNQSSSHPPGVEIYRDREQNVAVWEVDGRKNITYCQNLCLLAKLFLNSKTLYYDVEPFIFYVLTELDSANKYHFVGYFSKEKLNSSDYNVSCILTLPVYQRKGYGNFLIDFSYLLSRSEFKFGTPEKPLSDLGLLSYRNYWKLTIAMTLRKTYDEHKGKPIYISIETLSKLTGMIPSDVVVGLEQLHALRKNPTTEEYAIVVDLTKINHVIDKWLAKKYVSVVPDKLLWKPMLFGPSGGINSAPAKSDFNSIAHIAGFLKDDINNPLSFEDEARMEITPCEEPIDTDAFEECQSGTQFIKNKLPIKQSQEVKQNEGEVKENDSETWTDNEPIDDELQEPTDSEVLEPELQVAVDMGDDDDEESFVIAPTRRSARIRKSPSPVRRLRHSERLDNVL